MIKRIDVLISFPQGAVFTTNISEYLYRKLIHFVKDVSCLHLDIRCMDCHENSICRYHGLTGHNFTDYPAILMQQPLFEKKEYKQNEQKKFTFYLIGNQETYSEYILLFFEQLHQQINQQFFYLKETKSYYLEEKNIRCTSLRIKTPISQLSFVNEYNDMIHIYNTKYKTAFASICVHETWTNTKEIYLPPFKVKTTKKNGKGYSGYVSFSHAVELDQRLIELGIGRLNYRGGGRIEIENNPEQ